MMNDEEGPGVPGDVVRPLARFDTHDMKSRAKLVPVPLPVRLPREKVAAIGVGKEHCACVLARGIVYEWGVRRIVLGMGVAVPEGLTRDLGRVHIPSPVRVTMRSGDNPDVRCGDEVTCVTGSPGPP